MNTLIILAITLVVVSLYHSVAKNAAYQNMIERITPSWNVSINLV